MCTPYFNWCPLSSFAFIHEATFFAMETIVSDNVAMDTVVSDNVAMETGAMESVAMETVAMESVASDNVAQYTKQQHCCS